MLFLDAYLKKRPARLADWVYWGLEAAAPNSGVVLCSDGSFLRTMRFRGPDLDSATKYELVAIHAQINNVLKRLGSGWVTWMETRRREARDYPAQGHFSNTAAWMLDEERRAQFDEEGAHYESDCYITFQFRPPPDAAAKAENLLYDRPEDLIQTSTFAAHFQTFQAHTDAFTSLFRDIVPECRPLNTSELLTYLHSCVSPKAHPIEVPNPPVWLNELLCDTPLQGGIAPKLGDHHVRVLTINGFPSTTWPGILNTLNAQGIPFRWMTRFVHLDKADAHSMIESLRKYWFSQHKSFWQHLRETIFTMVSTALNTDAVAQTDDASAAMEELGSELIAYGRITTTVVVMDTDPLKAQEHLDVIARIVNGRGFTTIEETINAVEAWFSSHPANAYANVRNYPVSTLNFAHMIALSEVWAGEAENQHLDGPPLAYAQTPGTTPFRINLHQGDVGHTLIVGPTGSGKSVLLNFLDMQFGRYPDAQVFVIDKGGSSLVPITCMGGSYFNLSADGDMAFQPLAEIDDEGEQAWATDWIAGLLRREGVSITPERRKDIWQAIVNMAGTDRSHRTLTILQMQLQDDDSRNALQRFTMRGQYGRLLDADHDTFSLADIIGIEMENLMNTPDIVPAVLSLIFHRLEKRFTGRPTLLVLDEAWLFLDDPDFATRIREWLKTLRKHNVAVVFATQSLSDIAKSTIAPAVIENCPTRIYLPNPTARDPSSATLYEAFGLNPRQLEIIATAKMKQEYYYTAPAGNRLFSLGLGPVGMALCAATGKTDQATVRRLRADHPDHKAFLAAYLQKRGIEWAPDLLASLRSPAAV